MSDQEGDALERLVRDVYTAHWCLWQYGIKPEEIFVQSGPVALRDGIVIADGTVHVCVIARRGSLEFSYIVAPVADVEDFGKRWRSFASEPKALAVCESIVNDSPVRQHLVPIGAKLYERGFGRARGD